MIVKKKKKEVKYGIAIKRVVFYSIREVGEIEILIN